MQESTFLEEIFAERLNRELAIVHAKGLQEGRQEGLEKGARQAIRKNILDILTARFNPSAARYRHVEQQLETLPDVETLRELLLTLVQVEDLAGFEQALAQDQGA